MVWLRNCTVALLYHAQRELGYGPKDDSSLDEYGSGPVASGIRLARRCACGWSGEFPASHPALGASPALIPTPTPTPDSRNPLASVCKLVTGGKDAARTRGQGCPRYGVAQASLPAGSRSFPAPCCQPDFSNRFFCSSRCVVAQASGLAKVARSSGWQSAREPETPPAAGSPSQRLGDTAASPEACATCYALGRETHAVGSGSGSGRGRRIRQKANVHWLALQADSGRIRKCHSVISFQF